MRLFILGFLLGTFALQQEAILPLSAPPHWLIASGVCLPLALWLRGRGLKSAALPLLMVCGAMAGFAYAQWRAEWRLADALPVAWEGRDIQLIGAIASLPQVGERGTRFDVEVEQVLTEGAVVPSRLSLTWYSERGRAGAESTPPPSLGAGDRWHLTVRLRRPHGNANPHGFDLEAWLLERNVRATGYIRAKGTNERESRAATHPGATLDRLRQAILQRMSVVLNDTPYRGVLIALVLGEQNAIPPDQWKTFWRTGTGHLISISGLHITMIASLFYWLIYHGWARQPWLVRRSPAQRAAAVAGALAALGYALIAGFSVPTQRTFFMLLVIAVALFVGRGLSGSRILLPAVLAVLLIDPWAVLAPGFWLSFGAVALIFWVTSHRSGRPSAIGGAMRTQVAITLGLLPLTLALFQEVSLISPVANAFAIPLVSFVVVPLALLGALLPIDALLHLSHAIMGAGYAVLAWLAALPNAVWQSYAPSAWAVVAACVGVAIILMPRSLPGVVGRGLGGFLLLPLFLQRPALPSPGELWLTLLDVGQGLSVVVRTATHTLVYDTGPSYGNESDAGSRIITPYLRGEGLTRLDALIVTHDDDDHSGGAASLIQARNPGWVLTSLAPERAILKGSAEVMRCEVGDGWRWDGIDFDILHPTAENYADPNRKNNNQGCVLKISAPGGTVLLTADIEKISENELLARDPAGLKADVMVIPHHGSKTSSTDALLDAVQPRLALLPVGYRNRFRHPHPQVMARYAARHIVVRRTDQEGALRVKLPTDAAGRASVMAYRRERHRYWIDVPDEGGEEE
ncbi:MAG: DNA internalization-related competence protein ComEC/Rec2 [Betaproteobacteria bacterium]|nr:DNA internalization-related competence protein ComEC/Rec2 [Betaproteobacteria bacterium]